MASDTEELFRMFAFEQSKSGGQVKKAASSEPQKPVDWTVLASALKTCIPDLWPFELTGFTPTTPPRQTDDNSHNGVMSFKDTQFGTTFSVVNDPTPPPEVKAQLIQEKARGGGVKGNPFWTYTYPQADPRPRAGDLRYPELFGQISMDYIRVQIHETGAALTHIRDKYHPGPWASRLPDGGLDPTHPDDGPALEDCVGRIYYKQMGLTPH